MALDRHEVLLECSNCGGEHLHELTYAGRLLASSVCSYCGFRVEHDLGDLRREYVHDVEQRLLTKPRRMAQRALHHPVSYLAMLPVAVLTKPAKVLAEWNALRRRDGG